MKNDAVFDLLPEEELLAQLAEYRLMKKEAPNVPEE